MRGERDDCVGVSKSEACATFSQAVEVRGLRGSAVRRQRIGAQGVDGDEEDVLIGPRLEYEPTRPRPQAARRNQAGQNQQGP